MRFTFIATEVWQGLRRNLTMALSVVIVTFVSLGFLGSAALLQMQVTKLKDSWYNKVEVSIFLCPAVSASKTCASGAVTATQQDAIMQVLNSGAVGSLVKSVYSESKQEVWQDLIKQKENSFYTQHLTADDMQPVLRVKLNNPEQFQVVADATQNLEGVDVVKDQRDIFDTLFQVLNRATMIAAALAGVMLLAAVMLITTTIRLSALSRRRETTIMRMVGSSKTLIQLPFMLEGAIAATFGALLSIVGLWLAVRYLVEDWLSAQFNWIDYIHASDVLVIGPWLILIAVALSGVASLVTLGRYTSA
jgi:cell division transport system permease protein